jgi:hypothetical protein
MAAADSLLSNKNAEGSSMDGTDRMLVLVARNHDLLRVAAETRRQTLRLTVETRRRRQQARAAAAGARKAAEYAKEVAERAMLIMVRRAVLCAAAAGGWEASLEAVTTTLQRKRNPGTLMRRGRVGGEKPSDETKKAGRDTGPFALHSA